MSKDKSSPGLPDILGFIASLQEEKKREIIKREIIKTSEKENRKKTKIF